MIFDLGDYYGENTACKNTHLSFGIMGENLNPEDITAKSGINPSHFYAKGDKIISKNGIIRGERAYGIWALSTKEMIDSTSTEKHAKCLLDILEPRNDIFRPFIESNEFRTAVSIWWEANDEHGGYTISHNTMARIIILCNDIDFRFIG